MFSECQQCSYLTGEITVQVFSTQNVEFYAPPLTTQPIRLSLFLHQPFALTDVSCIMKFNHSSLISDFIFSSVSSWTRLGSSQSADIISDYNSCGRQPLSQILARKLPHSIWVPSAALVIFHCRSWGGVMGACMDYWMGRLCAKNPAGPSFFFVFF